MMQYVDTSNNTFSALVDCAVSWHKVTGDAVVRAVVAAAADVTEVAAAAAAAVAAAAAAEEQTHHQVFEGLQSSSVEQAPVLAVSSAVSWQAEGLPDSSPG